MPEDYRESELELKQQESSEELESQVQKAKKELEDLKRRQEQIEREKQRLEELSRKQEELENGRDDMVDKFTRALVILQKETEDSQKRLEQIHSIRNSFTQYLRSMEGINPKLWAPTDMQKELSKALSEVDAARSEYTKGHAKFLADLPEDSEAAAAMASEYEAAYMAEDLKGFGYWFKAGVAFTLPLLILGVIAVVLLALSLSPGQ